MTELLASLPVPQRRALEAVDLAGVQHRRGH